MGDLEISTLDKDGRETSVTITDVRLAPDVDVALISVSQLIGANFEVMLGTPPHLKTPSGATLPLHMVNGLYLLKGDSTPSSTRREAAEIDVTHAVAFGSARDPHSTSHIKALPPDEAARHMCRRLHLGVGKMRALPTITADVPSNLGKARTSTSPYMTTANATKRSHGQARYQESQPGRLVHLDIAGPLLESKIGRFRYLMLLIDDSSRFRIAIPMRNREEASAKIRGFVSRFNALAGASGGRIARVGSLLSDGAKELVSSEVQEYLDDNGADKKESPPGVHALNGCAERGILAVFRIVRAQFEQSHAPRSFWPESAASAVDILNRTSLAPHGRCSSYEDLTGQKPRVMSIMPFGCRAWAIKQTRNKTAIESTAVIGVNLGRSERQPGAYIV